MTPEEKEKNYELARSLLSEQNYQVAIVSGLIATILAAGIYAVITVATGYSISYLAVGVGALVGLTIQFLGRGLETKYAVLASVLAISGCVLGNVFAALILAARVYGAPPSGVASQVTLESLIEFVVSDFQPVDLIFWLMAVAAASYFAKRRLSREEGFALYTHQNRPKEGGIVT